MSTNWLTCEQLYSNHFIIFLNYIQRNGCSNDIGKELVILEFELNIAEYLELRGIAFKRSGANLMMSCPFHNEAHPSFGVNINNGKYHCLSGSCGAKGNLVAFVKKIEGLPSHDAAESWLRSNYGTNPDITNQPLLLTFGDRRSYEEVPEINFIPEEMLKQWDYRHPYLEGRGIGEAWQRRFRIGWDINGGCITIPWYDRLGRCVGIKKRSVFGKFFWTYHTSSVGPNKITLFGINHVFRKKSKSIIIVESEIDALYLWANGYAAVALGTSHITKAQLTELQNCPIEEVIIATDNDAAGTHIRDELLNTLTSLPFVKVVDWAKYEGVKDVNDLNAEQVIDLINTAITPVELLLR